MKNTFLIALLFIGAGLNAQDIIDTFAVEACQCIDSKKLDMNNLKQGELKKEFLGCFMKSYLAHMDDVAQLGLSTDDEEGMEEFGKNVGLKMMNHCPDYLLKFGQDYIDEADAKSPDTYTIEGEISDIKSEQFVTIQIKDKNARTHNLLLLEYFDTAALFTENQIGKKDKVSVSYKELELFDVKQKEFRYFKIITGLKKL